ncbi:MAG: [FeFe] hydrogenase H-cluster radical SAM maturase HydG [Phycisphaerales bacterium]|nr:[FeFe] hydrogenase H-cluster radical SAM maturase HydG [Phycisphaerales bacterium]
MTVMGRAVETAEFIAEGGIHATLDAAKRSSAARVREVLAKAREMKGLSLEEMAVLMAIDTPELEQELYKTGKWIKDEIYGDRLVLFAPLYVSNYCGNECVYCAFRARNKEIRRAALTQEQIAREVKILVEQGHKRVLLVAGESYPTVGEHRGLDYILKAVETIYATRSGKGEVRRVNVNLAPLTVADFKRLKAANIGTYQIFQETYHRETYARMHLGGLKRNYDFRTTACDRAMEAGIDDVGIGVLLGLCDWRFDLLAMMQHIRHLEERFGVGPHTVSVPRLEPATGSPLASHPPAQVSDHDFWKIVAMIRLAVPYTGIIMSTRENAEVRRKTFAMGVSQISAGSRTNPGGYAAELSGEEDGQFQLGDHRGLDEVVRDCAELGYIPSFCTACYRLGRTGRDFMDLAKPGLIKDHCGPNALASFYEYLLDYASPETKAAGRKLIAGKLAAMEPKIRERSETMLQMLDDQKRDVFV